MRDVELLAFDSFEDLAGRLLPGADDGMPRGKVAVHAATDAAGRPAILVEPIGAPTESPSGVKRVAGRLDTATNRVLTRRTLFESVLYKISRTDTVETLLQAIKPSRTGVAPELGRESHVLAWCPDGGTFSRLVRECLSLGCDRIRWAALGARGTGAVIVRIDSPPWYLLDRWQRADAATAPVFAPAAERFYVRWGFTHPFAGRLAVAENEIVLADGDGTLDRIPTAEWRDLYDAVQVAADGLAAVKWSPAEPAPRFTVKLRMIGVDPVEPELWLLGKDDLPAVERLLGLMPEADLKHLAIAFFAHPAAGQPVAALREVITGRGRGWVNFARTGFRALPGLPNLFLPVDRALDPQVRRDRVAEAFTLKPGEFQVVEADGDGMRAVRIPESSFKPLSTYIDYVVTADSAKLEQLVLATVFDPGPLAELAEAAADGPRGRAIPQKSGPTPLAANADGGEPAPVPIAVEPVGDVAVPQVPEDPAPVRSAEQELESHIAAAPPGGADDWMRLGDARAARNDLEGATECWENARWIDPALEEPCRTRSIGVLEKLIGASGPEAVLAALTDPGDIRALRLLSCYVEEARPGTNRAEFLTGLYPIARAAAATERLRKKTRWLAWKSILGQTGDDIEAERQREAILADLNQTGLAPIDRSDFVRARLAEQALGGGGDIELRRTMDGLTARISKIDEVRLRWTGMSLLARRWAELDDVGQARKLASQAVAGTGDASSPHVARVLANSAAALFRVRDPSAEAAFARALTVTGNLTNGDERGRTLNAILESLGAVGDPATVQPLAERALGVLEKESDPRRAALILQRISPALKKLEATAKARQMAAALAREPQVVVDAHYLQGAVTALATLSAGTALPRAVIDPILNAVRKQRRDIEEIASKLIDGAVTLGGEEYAREICDEIRSMQAAEIKFAQLSSWASAIQGLAAARAADVGLADLDRALKLAWGLPNDDERRRSVRKLTTVIAAFGRVGAGLEMVHDVVRRAEATGVGPYFRSEVLSACVDVAAKLGQRKGAFEVMARVIQLVETTARSSAGDVTFLFDVLGLCVDHAVTIGAAGESAAVIRRVVGLVEEWMDESSARYWTPFYRYRALAKCGRGYARLGQEEEGLKILSRILDHTPSTSGLDRKDLLEEIVHSLSEVGGAQRLQLVDRILDSFLAERSASLGDAGGDLLAKLLDEVVSPASRVRAEYARFLGAEERSIRERVANEKIIGK